MLLLLTGCCDMVTYALCTEPLATESCSCSAVQWATVCMAAGEVRNFSRWKNSLAHLDGGRYANDTVVDYLQNKDTKALVFTDKHLVYINLKRHRLRWAFPVAHLSTVTTHGVTLFLPVPNACFCCVQCQPNQCLHGGEIHLVLCQHCSSSLYML